MRSLLVSLCLCSIGPHLSLAQAPPALVGVWELERFDNLLPADAPDPENQANLRFAFRTDGTFVAWRPGQEAEQRQWELSGSVLQAWLGLTNDRAGNASVTWPHARRMEVTYPDQSAASLRLISQDSGVPPSMDFHCIPITVRGITYNPDAVQRAKRLLDESARHPSVPSPLVGSWRYVRSSHMVTSIVVLTFGAEGTIQRCVSSSAPAGPPEIEVRSGAVRVVGEALLASTLACGEAITFRVDRDTLTLSSAQGAPTVFARAPQPTECRP